MNNKVPWSLAAKNGLLLSLLTIVIETPAALFDKMPSFLATVLTALKILGSYYLLLYFVRKHTSTLDYVTGGQSFRYGMAISLFSGIVCTLASLITFTILVPDLIPQSLDLMFQQLDSMGMSETVDYNTLLKAMPVYLIIGKIFSCLVWGAVFSLIIAQFTKTPTTPFGTEKPKED